MCVMTGNNYVGLMKSTLGSMDNRSTNLVTFRDIERTSVDYYATMRTLYMERRARLIEDRRSAPPNCPISSSAFKRAKNALTRP